MQSERAMRGELVRYSKLVYDKGWVANHDGNLSVRARADRIICTPTSFSKGDVSDDTLLTVDATGKKTSGHTRPFSELSLHLAIFDARPDVRAVVHAHPPFATAMACAGVGLDQPFIPEAVVSLGDRIPLVPFAAPKTPAFSGVLEPYLPVFDALILECHGVVAYGVDLEQAFLRLELVEHLAQIATHARAWGGVRALAPEVVTAMLSARTRAGLGPEARGVPTQAPRERSASALPPAAPPARDDRAQAPGGLDRAQLVRVIAEELAALANER